jgi:hypothetical protein
VTNFGYEWEVAESKNVRTKYKAGSAGEITADITVYMGLRGINVTMKGNIRKGNITNILQKILNFHGSAQVCFCFCFVLGFFLGGVGVEI